MAVVTIVATSTMAREGRWEAEFYDPKYIPPKLRGAAWRPIGDYLLSAQYGSSKPLNEVGRGFSILRLNELQHGLVTRPKKYVDLSPKQYKTLEVAIDDLLFCRTNGNFFLVGRAGMLKEQLRSCFASYLVRVRADRTRLRPEFLNVYLNAALGRTQIQRRAMRSNQVNVSAAQLRRIPIPIPDEFAVQNQVAELFNMHAHATLEARRLYHEGCALIDSACPLPAPSTALLGERLRLKDLLGVGRWDSEYVAPVARAARRVVLDYPGGYLRLVDVAAAMRPLAEPVAVARKPLEYVQLADLNPIVGLIDSASDVSADRLPDRARRVVARGDVLVSAVAGSSDKAALVDEEYAGAVASTGFVQLRASSVLPAYLLALTRSAVVRIQLEREATGGILSAVPSSRLANIIVPALSPEIQSAAAQLVERAHNEYRSGLERFAEAKALVEALVA